MVEVEVVSESACCPQDPGLSDLFVCYQVHFPQLLDVSVGEFSTNEDYVGLFDGLLQSDEPKCPKGSRGQEWTVGQSTDVFGHSGFELHNPSSIGQFDDLDRALVLIVFLHDSLGYCSYLLFRTSTNHVSEDL